MKTKLQTALAALAPSISIRTIWEHDEDHDSFIFRKGNALHGEDPDDWQQWQSEVRATAIVNGDELTGSAYLGAIWEKYGDDPATTNPEISGYENQNTVEALKELLTAIEALDGSASYLLRQCLTNQIGDALAYLKAEAQRSYDEQQAARATV